MKRLDNVKLGRVNLRDAVYDKYAYNYLTRDLRNLRTISNSALVYTLEADIFLPILDLLNKKGLSYRIEFQNATVSRADCEDLTPESLKGLFNLRYLDYSDIERVRLHIINISTGRTLLKQALENNNLFTRIPGVERVIKPYSPNLAVAWSYNETSLVLFVATDETAHVYRRLLSILPMVQRYVEYTPEEQEVLKAFGGTSYEAYAEAFDKYVESTALASTHTRGVLHDILYASQKIELQSVESEIESAKADVAHYEDRLIRAYNRLEDLSLKQRALQLMSVKQDDEAINDLQDYINRNPAIRGITREGSRIAVNIVTELEYYDKDLVQRLLNDNILTNSATLQEILKRIFIDQEYTVIVGQKILWAPDEHRFAGVSHKIENYLNNTHLSRYNCFGANKLQLTKASAAGNVEVVFDILVASVKNFNFNDSTVRNAFLSDLWVDYRSLKTIRHNETGTMYSVDELTEIIKGVDNNEVH